MQFYPKNIFLIFRRLGAFSYDLFLLVSVVFILGAIGITFNSGKALDPLLFSPVSITATLVFFTWFWTHGGQTLGMRAWRIKLTDSNTAAVTLKISLIRITVMTLTLGLGTLWILFDKNGQSLQDKLSQSVMHRTTGNSTLT